MRTQKNRLIKIVILISLLAFLITNSKTITSRTRTAYTDTCAPAMGFTGKAWSVVCRIVPFASLRAENKLLRERISLLNRRMEELKMISGENDRLKSLIGFRKNIPFSTVPAQVIGRDPSNWSNSLIVNKGAEDGITYGRGVISNRGLVGRVLELGRRSAKILLITDPNSKVGVLIQRNRQGGVLVGRPDGTCKIVYISLDSDVAPGDKVITAGLGTIFPKDILVGEVVGVGKEPGRLYKYAVVKTAEEMSRLEEVLCIR